MPGGNGDSGAFGWTFQIPIAIEQCETNTDLLHADVVIGQYYYPANNDYYRIENGLRELDQQNESIHANINGRHARTELT